MGSDRTEFGGGLGHKKGGRGVARVGTSAPLSVRLGESERVALGRIMLSQGMSTAEALRWAIQEADRTVSETLAATQLSRIEGTIQKIAEEDFRSSKKVGQLFGKFDEVIPKVQDVLERIQNLEAIAPRLAALEATIPSILAATLTTGINPGVDRNLWLKGFGKTRDLHRKGELETLLSDLITQASNS